MIYLLYKRAWMFLLKTKYTLALDPVIMLFGIYDRETKMYSTQKPVHNYL